MKAHSSVQVLFLIVSLSFVFGATGCAKKNPGGGGGGGYSTSCSQYKQKPTGGYYTQTEIQQAMLSVARPAPKEMAFYRWGNADYETPRIGANPIFDMATVNAGNGGTAGGRGLYVATDPTASASYGTSVSPQSKATIITIIVPAGTPLLDVNLGTSDLANLQKLGLDAYDAQNCDPPVVLGYSTGWWVMKTNQYNGIPFRAEAYTGKYLDSPSLLQHQQSLESSYRIATPTYKSLGDLVKTQVMTTLSERPHYPSGIQEPIPTPPKSVHPVSQWYSVPELRTETPPAAHLPIQYRWTWYGGRCNGYYFDNEGHYVLALPDSPQANCEPTRKMQIYSHSSGLSECHEVVNSDPRVIVRKLPGSHYNCY